MRPADDLPAVVTRRFRSIAEAAGAAAALVRYSALGGTLVLPLVGAASASGAPSGVTAVLALTIGCAFHVFAYVLNDVVDLPLDATDPRRTASPLVTGLITPPVALALAVAMLGVASLAAAQAGPQALAALFAAALGLGAYDALGKRTRWPPLSDVVQGAGWAALVLVGTWLVGGPTPLGVVIAAYVAVYIVMANGVHGAIRDLENDALHGVRTTASLLGATSTPGRGRSVPRTVLGYAWALQVALLIVTLAALLAGGSAVAIVPSVAAVGLLAAATRARSDADLLAAGMLHLLAGLLVPVGLVAASASPAWLALAAIAYVVPLLAHGWLPRSVAFGFRALDRAIGYGLDLARLARPHNCLAAAAAVVVGAHLGGRADLVMEPVLRAALVAGLVVAAANVANDRADVAEDLVNRPDRPIPAGRVSRMAAGAFALVLAALAIGLAAGLGAAPAAVAIGLTLVAAAYSGYPGAIPALKSLPLVGTLSVAALSASTISFGALVLARATPAAGVATAFVFVSVFSSEVLKATADRDGDAASGRATIATRLPVGACLRLHGALVIALVGAVPLAAVAGVAGPAFLGAGLVGIVAPQVAVLAGLRGAADPSDVRRVLPLSKLAWFAGLASLVFLA